MRSQLGRTTTGLAMAAAAALGLTACGGSSDSTGTTTSSSAPAPTSSSASAPASDTASAAGTAVTVTETEFKIAGVQPTYPAGSYTFKVTNGGKFPHNLIIEGPGVDKQKTATLQGGQSGDLTVTLTAGSYELWCGVDSHKDKGMDMKITVS